LSTEGVHRKLAAILCADVEGYSRLMQDDPEGTLHTLTAHREVFRRCTEYHDGRVVDSPGDNILIEFASAIEAVQCAVEIQRELAEKNAELAYDRRMRFRIGIDLGELLEKDDALYGDGVNISARLQSLAESGGICVSGRAYDQVVNRLTLKFEFLGRRSVKNISHPIRVYRVLTRPETTSVGVKEKNAARMVSRRLAVTTLIALIIIAAGSLIWNIYSNNPRKIEQASEPEQAPIVADVEEAPKTIAVLPFENMSPDPDQEYFVDGLSEEILNSLAQIPQLTVIARTSSFSFKGTTKTIQEIAEVLGVENLLEGSVRKAGNALRITAQLVRATDGAHLWSKTYDRKLEDIFAVQKDIATTVVDELKIKLGIGESIKQSGGTDNIKAYELYLIASGIIQTSASFDGNKPALNSINAAIELDPEFALAWSLKSALHTSFFIRGVAAEREASISAALRAIELQPNLPTGYSALGTIKATSGEFIEAKLAFEKASELNAGPSAEMGYYLLLHSAAYFKKAHELLEEARRKDPLNRIIRQTYVENLGYLGNIEQAEKENDRCMEIFGNDWGGNKFLTQARLGSGKAVTRDQIVIEEFQSSMIDEAAKDYLESPEDGLSELHRFYNDKDYQDVGIYTSIAYWAAYFGDFDLSMDSIEKAVSMRPGNINNYWYPLFSKVRQMPQFKKLVREIGLIDFWNQFGWPDLCKPTDDGDFVCD